MSAVVAAERVWHAVRDQPFMVDGTPVVVRVSIGVASWPRQAGPLNRACCGLLTAPLAQAKSQGRDQVTLTERLSD